MALISLDKSMRDSDGSEGGRTNRYYSFNRRIAPVINGRTLAVGDVLSITSFSYRSVVDITMKHFGTNGTDATFAADVTYAAFDISTSGVSLDPSGDPILLHPNYFAAALAFDTARTEEFSLQTQESFRETQSIGEGLAIAGTVGNPSQQAVLVMVVTAIPTGTLDLAFKVRTRG